MCPMNFLAVIFFENHRPHMESNQVYLDFGASALPFDLNRHAINSSKVSYSHCDISIQFIQFFLRVPFSFGTPYIPHFECNEAIIKGSGSQYTAITSYNKNFLHEKKVKTSQTWDKMTEANRFLLYFVKNPLRKQ